MVNVSRRKAIGMTGAAALLNILGMRPAHATGLSDTTASSPQLEFGPETRFDPAMVLEKAKALAAKAYVAPAQIAREWVDLDYDQYRTIRFNERAALWRGEESRFQLHFFAPGLYFPKPVEIYEVDNGRSRQVRFNLDNFHVGEQVPELPVDDTTGFSGFRIHRNLAHPKQFNEYVVFQGASYFRAIGRGNTYGLSARGLALNTAGNTPEEFPDFRQFWVERASPDSTHIIVHALLDSPSVAGAYRFRITPGDLTAMEVEATLFPRTDLTHVGIAPQTSMFLFDETNRNRFDDFRPAVHDNDGLMIKNGNGEQLWRPLANPRKLQTSSFVDDNPRGFGLMQRASSLAEFADLEAQYHQRPGLWVEPGENWGKGSVTLVEIPADREIYDNIVTYWRPRAPLAAGTEHRFTYKLTWGKQPADDTSVARVLNTRSGARHGGGRIVTVDFAPHDKIPTNLDDLKLMVGAGSVKTTKPIVQRNPETGGVRVGFTFYPENRTHAEMRVQMMVARRTVSEVWLYRWTR